MRTAVLALLAGCAGAPNYVAPPEVPAPNPVVPATSDDVAVCAHLGVLGCGEAFPGTGAACIGALSQARTYAVVIPTKCLLGAANKAAIRACGTPDTLSIECP